MVLELENLGKYKKYIEILKSHAGEGWRGSVGPTVWK
jgi:hypothetical protein